METSWRIKMTHYRDVCPDLVPFVLSAYGLLDKRAKRELAHWQDVVPLFSYMLSPISVDLLRARLLPTVVRERE